MTRPIMGGVPRASFDPARYAVTFVGNSIADASYNSDLVAQISALPPISNRFQVNEQAWAGFSMSDLESVSKAVDDSFQVGKVNFLPIFELTNTIYNQGKTGLQACAEMKTYIGKRLAAHPWKVIIITGIPRGSLLGNTWDAVTGEAQMEAANAYIRANYRDMGALAYIEARRPGGPFDFTDCTNMNNFPSSLWKDPTHPNNAGGNVFLAQYIADGFKRLPAR